MDTVHLDEVTIQAQLEDYTPGSATSTPDSLGLKMYQANNLGELLESTTGIYLRQYGAEGQLTSVSFRGTTPNQTQVNWQGVNINSRSLGQTDFSNIPSFLFSDINLHHGPGSTLFGSGAVGGVVRLEDNAPKNTQNIVFTQQVGSYGKSFTGLKGQYATGDFGVTVAMLHDQIKNDFEVPFRGTKYQQNNAESKLDAGKIDLYKRIKNSKISGSFWYNNHNRKAQPLIGDINSKDSLKDVNLRSMMTWENVSSVGYIKLSGFYIDDRQSYDSSNNNLKRIIGIAEYEAPEKGGWNIRTGGKYAYTIPHFNSYETGVSQVQADWFGMVSYHGFSQVRISGTVRVPYMQYQKKVPIIPTIGVKSDLIKTQQHQLLSSIQVSRSFRFPTLNDLFYQPGGNKNLNPEDGLNAETGLKWKHQKNGFSIDASINGYKSWLRNMIVWLPKGSYWSPQNFNTVKITGAEVSINLQQELGSASFSLTANYSRNQSLVDSQQLPYVPLNKLAGLATGQWRKWIITYQWQYTGMRYTMTGENANSLSGYALMSMRLAKEFSLKDHKLSAGFQVRNLFDKVYQNYENRATPGRNYLVSIYYQFHNRAAPNKSL